MINLLINLLVLVLVFVVCFWLIGFIGLPYPIREIVLAIFALIFLVIILKRSGIIGPGGDIT